MTWSPPTPKVTPARIQAIMDELRDELALIEVNGQALGSAVVFDPANLGAQGGVGVLIMPLTFDYAGSPTLDPSSASTEVWIVVPNNDGVVTNLYAMALGVAQCIHGNTRHAVLSSTPAGFLGRGGADMPGYVIDVAVDLTAPAGG